ncbi:ABC transport system substrate-binding protein [Chondrocystis sp. NIES-4102]|nr:ABC transport system substrate-binding protein [Chondrocystis sp. NIES-4102]
MNRRKLISIFFIFCFSLISIISCTQDLKTSYQNQHKNPSEETIVIGYSEWAGWLPWAIADEEGLFKKYNVNVDMKWFSNYLESMEALAAGQLDGNCQTLSDTISFAADAVNGEAIVLVNDYSAGNDKIIVTKNIKKIEDLKGKKVAVEEGLITDFLLTLALESKGMNRDDVEIVPLQTSAATAAFTAGKVDAVGTFPPFWVTAIKAKDAQELISSKAFPGAIPDVLAVSKKLINEQPAKVQALVNTWFDIMDFIVKYPDKARQIMAERSGVTIAELELFEKGVKLLTIEENIQAFKHGNDIKHISFTAKKVSQFMMEIGFIPELPDLTTIFDPQFVQAYAKSL